MPETYKQEIKLFYCYAREDKALRDELEKHLSNLKRQYHLTTWYDHAIPPGEDWEQEIDKQLSTANLVLLLISSDFMASDYCYSKEMLKALERERAGACRVIPILLRPTDWEGAPFSHLQMRPTDTRPVTSWSNRDEAFWDIALGIRRTLEDLLVAFEIKDRRLEEGVVLTQHQPSKHALTNAPIPTIEKQNPGVIDLSIEAALKIEADKHPISLADLHNAYLQANPSI